MSDKRDVSGGWEGIFNYPRLMTPNAFTAELVERAGAITGETREASDSDHDSGAAIAAIVEGERIGSAVRLTKRYDDLARAHYAVRYDGRVSDEGDEIVGEWTIPGIWSGTFIMVRRSRAGAAEERRATETVR